MSTVEKAYGPFLLENGPTDFAYFTSDTPLISYTASEFSYLWGDGSVRFTYYGQFPDLTGGPTTYGDLLNSPASMGLISSYTVTAGPNSQENLTDGTLLLEGSLDGPWTVEAVSLPSTGELGSRYYSGDDTFVASNSPSVTGADTIFGYGGNDTFFTYSSDTNPDMVYGGEASIPPSTEAIAAIT